MPVSNDVKTDRAARYEASGIRHVPCAVCEAPTRDLTSRRCDKCEEVEHRLADYLHVGGEEARKFVRNALYEANFDATFAADEGRR